MYECRESAWMRVAAGICTSLCGRPQDKDVLIAVSAMGPTTAWMQEVEQRREQLPSRGPQDKDVLIAVSADRPRSGICPGR
jgi:hypothetical protein